jgi:hypothetical protein
MDDYRRHRTSIWIRLALWLQREQVKDYLALIAVGVVIGWLLAQGV